MGGKRTIHGKRKAIRLQHIKHDWKRRSRGVSYWKIPYTVPSSGKSRKEEKYKHMGRLVKMRKLGPRQGSGKRKTRGR